MKIEEERVGGGANVSRGGGVVSGMGESEYAEMLNTAMAQIMAARCELAVRVSTAASSTYWNLGKLLHDRKIADGYGAKAIRRLSTDLKRSFPDMGLSPRNLWNMKMFYERYAGADKKVLQAVALLQWGHNLLLMSKNLSDDEVLFYATESTAKGWSRELLLNAVKMNTYSAGGNLRRTNNFADTLCGVQAQQANEILRDSYNLGFLGITEPVSERELERRLVEKIRAFMLELGKGFAFIGNQYRLEYNDKEYFVDLLFFNRKLNCMVAIDLKIGEFKSEYAGKMNMYLSLLEKQEKEPGENRPIGVILCAEKDRLDVELALQDINKPIAVSEYDLIIPRRELQELVMSEMKARESDRDATD